MTASPRPDEKLREYRRKRNFSLKFRLHGEKLKGGWVLVRMRGRRGDGRNWLLIKEQYSEAISRGNEDVL